MRIAEVPLKVLRIQYQIARMPLQLIENQLAARLTDDTPARVFYERSLGTLDATVGGLLGDEQLRRRGEVLTQRDDEPAVRPDDTPDEAVTDTPDTADEPEQDADEQVEWRAAEAIMRTDEAQVEKEQAERG